MNADVIDNYLTIIFLKNIDLLYIYYIIILQLYEGRRAK